MYIEDSNFLSHVTENTYGDLFSIEYMIEKGKEVLDSGTFSIYSSNYDQSEYCDATKYEYIRLLLVEGYTQYMMAKQAEYENEVEAIHADWDMEAIQKEMYTSLRMHKEYYQQNCPCLVTDARGPYCGETSIIFNTIF